MITFFNTHVAKTAMFAAGWLIKIASFAFLFGLVDQVVIFEAFKCLLMSTLSDVTWLDCTRFVIAIVTSKHKHTPRVFVVFIDIRTW